MCPLCVHECVHSVGMWEILATFSLYEISLHSYPWTKSLFRILIFFLDKNQVSDLLQGHRYQLNSELKIKATENLYLYSASEGSLLLDQ